MTFATAGPKTVRLRVTDNEGAIATASSTVTAHRNPVAAFTYLPNPVERNVEVTFTSTSTDPENRLATQSWDLDGDGAYDDGTGATAKRTFTTAAGNAVGLRVTDLDGGSDERRIAIVPGNKLPTLSVSAQPAAPSTGIEVAFTAAAADPDGTITGIAWDLDGDGAFDDATGAAAARGFAIAGSYTVRARAEDDDGATTEATLTVPVADRAPVAGFTYAQPVRRGVPVTFTSTSSDPEGRLKDQAWDLDGDGAYDDGTGVSATRTFHAPRATSSGCA